MITAIDIRSAIPQAKEAGKNDAEVLASTVIEMWERATGRLWNFRQAHQQLFRSVGSGTILLDLLPVATVTAVEERERGSASWVALAASQWVYVPRRSIERVSGCWSYQVRVTYDGGYKADGTGEQKTPSDVRRAMITQAQFLVERYSQEKVALRSQSFAGGNSTFFENSALHPLFQEASERHARKF